MRSKYTTTIKNVVVVSTGVQICGPSANRVRLRFIFSLGSSNTAMTLNSLIAATFEDPVTGVGTWTQTGNANIVTRAVNIANTLADAIALTNSFKIEHGREIIFDIDTDGKIVMAPFFATTDVDSGARVSVIETLKL